ncbi:MAG: Polysaccharide biosynthesis protein [Candidatus Curtissbacteria bacterium GW2011_GWC2_38_9]|uniref:Polysaccharide biosynthesis protein C-terminal domain-containing protein n=3 Tax=Candidatus Curtissiibacteriota TaxID=1752717 RepID=A0A1F5HPK9_9BACT|nr:MAG: Polysaccharide biosynthesis protein [Candidatus Curtissbacteria bacterium GW2011_GWC2_38_9]KKS04436.1 MAG: Polysaccharide biosynthesis protein [Candidatus Curtissbacteria bacterium GW2011_GWA2_41_24]OGD89601.1 MAG: hypothetical protein A2Z54_01815 [Candidatus Curtissbacteria bacterium RIFCSPHIGHO2_02_39_8]OGE06098.1 MAG: hypothetical protein A2W70_05125 [Candidatus Curtissbacteria bacterium RIFCSPLOWO2_02_41_11]
MVKNIVRNKIYPLLAYTGLEADYLVFNGGWIFIRQILTSLSTLAIVFFFTRFGSKEDFGAYNLILSISALASVFSLPGVATAVIQSVASGFDRSYFVGLRLRFFFSITGSFFLMTLAYYYFLKQAEALSVSIFLVALVFPFLNTFGTYDSLLSGKKLFRNQSISSVSISGIVSLGTIVAIFLKLNVIFIIFTYFFLTTVLNIFFHSFFTKYLSKDSQTDSKFKEYSYFMSFISGLSLVAANLDKILLGSLSGFSSLAIYSTALLIPDGITRNLKAFMGIYTVKLAGKSSLENKKVLAYYYLRLILIGFILSFALWFTLPFLIPFLFSAKYVEAVGFARLISITLILSPIVTALSSAVVFEKRYKDTLLFNIFPQGIKILLYFILIPSFGILGIVFSLMFERLISVSLLTYIVFKK